MMFTEDFTNTYTSLQAIAKKQKVLYVEDDPLIRAQYVTFLSRFFEEIDIEENGEAGLKRALSKKYDILISDIQMPKLNGLDMIIQIKKVYPDQAVLLISAHKDSDILHRSVLAGVDGYLLKPLERVQTIETIYKLVSKIHLQKENEIYKHHLEELVRIKTEEAMTIYTTDRTTSLYSLAKLEQDIFDSPTSSLILFKIRDFKMLNDFYGYDTGNIILGKTASFLAESVNEKLQIPFHGLYRVSGAHFALLIPEDTERTEHYARQIIHLFEAIPFIIEGEEMYLEMSAGIIHSRDGLLLSHADAALREAEKSECVVTYKTDTGVSELHAREIKCKNLIKGALTEERVVPFYQPIVDNRTKAVVKYEALARLITPSGEIMAPSFFMMVSKKTKMYPLITKTIIQSVLKDFRQSPYSVSINLSIDDIKHTSSREFLYEQIAQFPDPDRLIFELLESEGIDSYAIVIEFLQKIKEFGCKIAIDDFGSGYSSFEHLSQLNVDYLKIDGSLIQHIETDQTSLTIVETIAEFATRLGIKTIAEYVTSESIGTIVASLGIHESQGYHYGKPLPLDEIMYANPQNNFEMKL